MSPIAIAAVSEAMINCKTYSGGDKGLETLGDEWKPPAGKKGRWGTNMGPSTRRKSYVMRQLMGTVKRVLFLIMIVIFARPSGQIIGQES